MGFCFGELRSSALLKSDNDRGKFLDLLRQVHGDPQLRELCDCWLRAYFHKDIRVIKKLGVGRNLDDDLNFILRFFEFDSFTVERSLNDSQKDMLVSEQVRLSSGLTNIQLCISEKTKSVVCLGFENDDVSGLAEVLSNSGVTLDVLKFFGGRFSLDVLEGLDALYNGGVGKLDIRSNYGPSFVGGSIDTSNRFKFLEKTSISSLTTSSLTLHGADGYSFGEMFYNNPNIESISIDGGISDDSFLTNMVNNSEGKSSLQSISLSACDVSDDGFSCLIDSGFLDDCREVSLRDCLFVTSEMIATLPILLPGLVSVDLDHRAKYLLLEHLS